MSANRELPGERLRLRPLRESDVNPRYLGWLRDREVTRYLEVAHHPPQDAVELRAYVARFLATDDEIYAIEERGSGLHIGNVTLNNVDQIHRSADTGLLIGERDRWGQGLASEAWSLVIDHGFRHLGLRKLIAAVCEGNVASLKALERLGFAIEGRLKGECMIDGTEVDRLRLGLFPQMFRPHPGALVAMHWPSPGTNVPVVRVRSGDALMTDTVVIVQARTDSSRLPGKSLASIGDRAMVLRVLDRAAQIGPQVILATTTRSIDDQLVALVESAGVNVFRGSTDDVLGRFTAAAPHGVGYIVRVTADCPLLDPALGRAALQTLRSTNVDYVSNTLRPTFPDGLDVEAVTADALSEAASSATLLSDREHVTPFIKRSDRFRKLEIRHDPDLSQHRWTVDDARDLEFVRQLHLRLDRHSAQTRSSMYSVLEILAAEPWLRDLNRGTERDEGYRRSIEREGVGREPRDTE